ncbi:MAG TPA: DUF3300 domain-containing protein [Roseiarcus sp.]|nr:DUF3300 domain-containing protein [Roseiarcus sp.]
MMRANGRSAKRAAGLFALTVAIAFAADPLVAAAQNNPAPAAAPAPALAPAAAPAHAAAPPAEAGQAPANSSFSREELEKLLAPIALYPDPLLAQMLPASAYPVQIVQAQRWLDKNKALVANNDYSGIDKQDWDPAVKALARFPDVIKKMSDDLDWTTDLGDAEVNQPQDVADVIQALRAKAEKAGNLKTTDQQTVEKVAPSAPPAGAGAPQGAAAAPAAEASYISIQPTDPSTVYVPTYDDAAVYQPYTGIAPLLGFGAGVAVGALWNNNYWNWGTGAIYPPVWAGYSGWRAPYAGWRPGQPVCPGGRCGNINNGNINVGNNVNIGNVGNNVRPWRPNNSYRPGMGSKPGIGASRPGGRPGGIGGAGRPGGPGGPGGIGGAGRPGGPGGIGGAGRPGGPGGPGGIGGAGRPGGGQAANRPATRPAGRPGGAGQAARPANRPAQRPASRPAARPGMSRPGSSAMGGMRMGGANTAFANRGAVSRGGMPGGFGGAGMRGGGGFGGGGNFRGGGGGGGRGGGGRGGGGRRSDMRLKHDIVLLGRLDDGLGYYRFVYNGGHTAYVGVMAQEVETVAPEAVMRGADGFLRVSYDLLGLPFETYAQWVAAGAHLPSVRPAAK